MLGRFISADPLVPEPGHPQALDRYAYTLNNPLKYTDPSGHVVEPPTCPWCDRPWISIQGWPSLAVNLAQAACFVVGCQVDLTAGLIWGPRFEDWLETQAFSLSGLANPIQAPGGWIGRGGPSVAAALRALREQGVHGVERLAAMIERGVRGAVFQGQRALYYADQLVGVEVELIFPRGLGRVDLLLTGHRIIETKAWTGWSSMPQWLRDRLLIDLRNQVELYLSDPKYALLFKFKEHIPQEVIDALRSLAKDPQYGGRLGWRIVP